jgi:beta-glucosidase
MSFPRHIEEPPAYDNFPGETLDGQLEVKYAEDMFVEYGHYDLLPKDRLNFAVGYGLLDTTFSYEG